MRGSHSSATNPGGAAATKSSSSGARANVFRWLMNRLFVFRPGKFARYKEFALCEYAKDREGNWVDDYNDGNDHSIDAVRYAMMRDILHAA